MPMFRVTSPDGKTYRVNAPEGATQADAIAYVQAQQGGAQPAGAAPGGSPPDLGMPAGPAAPGSEYDPAADMNFGEKALVGAGGAIRKDYLALRSLVPGQGLTDDEKREMEEYKQSKQNLGTAGTVGDIGAEALMALAPGGVATRGIRAATSALPLARAALLRGAGETAAGAAYGAATSLPEDRGMGALTGAGGTLAGLGLGRLVGGFVKPLVRPEAQALAAEGVQPTLGQALGGTANTVEQQLMSVPLVGNVIGKARSRALDEFNTAAIQKAAPGVQGFGDDAVMAARDAISEQYKSALGRMPQNFNMEANPIIAATIKAGDDPALALSQGSQKRLYDYVEKNLLQRQSQLTPEVAKRIESDLGQAVQRFSTSGDAEDRALGAALRQVQTGWRDSLTGIGNTAGNDAGDALRAADASWRAFLPVDAAAASRAAQGTADAAGQFTPKMLRKALEVADSSANNRATRFMQAGTPEAESQFGQLNMLARNADRTLSATIPDSGTAGRGALLGAGGIIAGAMNPALIAKAAAAWAITKGLYSRPGQKFAMEGASKQIANVLRGVGVPDSVISKLDDNSLQYLLATLRGTAAQ